MSGSQKADILCSLRFNEEGAFNEAQQVCAELKKRYNLNAVIVNVPPGSNIDIMDEVCRVFDEAKLILIFGTENYGEAGKVKFSTKEELQLISDTKKPFFLIKMCAKFRDTRTTMILPSSTAAVFWAKGKPMPNDLITKIADSYMIHAHAHDGQSSSSKLASNIRITPPLAGRKIGLSHMIVIIMIILT